MNVKKYFVAAFAALMTCAAQADEGMPTKACGCSNC